MEDWSSFGFLRPSAAGPMSRSCSLKLRSAVGPALDPLQRNWCSSAVFLFLFCVIYSFLLAESSLDCEVWNLEVSSTKISNSQIGLFHRWYLLTDLSFTPRLPPLASLLWLQMWSVPSTIHTPSLKNALPACTISKDLVFRCLDPPKSIVFTVRYRFYFYCYSLFSDERSILSWRFDA